MKSKEKKPKMNECFFSIVLNMWLWLRKSLRYLTLSSFHCNNKSLDKALKYRIKCVYVC